MVLSKLFPKRDPNEISKLYSMYGNTNITLEDNISDSGNPFLSEQAWKELLYINYDLESFSKYERVSAQTRVAVDSIYQIMKVSDIYKIFIRINNAQYGNKTEEQYGVKSGPLSFYNERNFMHFIYVIDKLTDGNISSLISSTYSQNDDRLERKINLNDTKYRGSTVAKAIICGKKLDEMATVLTDLENSKPINKITIKDFLSEDLLRKLYSQDQSFFNQIDKENEETLKICKSLQPMATKFYKDLENIEKNVGEKNIQPNYMNIREYQQWINFLVEFTQTFFNHRLGMIKAVKLAMNKLENKNIEANALKPGETNSRIGKITIYSNEDFNKLSENELQKITKNIVNQTIDKYFGVNKLPIYVFTFKDAAKYGIRDIEKGNIQGITYCLFSSNKLKQYVDIDKLKSYSSMNNIENNEQTIKELLDLYFNNIPKISINELKPEGTLILMDASIDKLYKFPSYGKLMSLITQSVLYYSYVVHETIHTLQFNDVKNDFKNTNNITQGYYNKLNENKGIFNKNLRNSFYQHQSYILNTMETESMSEQRNFILSIKRSEYIDQRVKLALKSANFIHKV
jgi:hypothetical protein